MSMTDAAPAPAAEEPSIEEILASIRKIISDEPTPEGEEAAAPAANDIPDMPPPPVVEPETSSAIHAAPEPEEDILDLGAFAETSIEALMENPFEPSSKTPAAPTAPAPPPAEEPNLSFDLGLEDSSNKEIMPDDVNIDHIMANVPSSPPAGDAVPLVSTPSENAATAAFAKLNRAAEPDYASQTQLWVGQRTIEQVVEDLMRPMLKAWLDQNLPRLVERLVEKELARMARRASE